MHNLIKLKPKQHMMPIELSVNLTAEHMPTETEIRKQKKLNCQTKNATHSILYFVVNQRHFLLVFLDRQIIYYYLTTKFLCNMNVWRKTSYHKCFLFNDTDSRHPKQ
jgi:hypothetical protein